jgi:hypothetical protein
MDTLLCNKLTFHTFAERQGWLLLFDKVSEDKSEIGYLLQDGGTIFATFNVDGNFDHMNDTRNATIGVNFEEERDDY